MILQITKAAHKRIEANSRKLVEYLRVRCCLECGESDPVVLDLDHVRGEKINEVSSLVASGFSWTRIEAEIEKCVVRCANCHRKKSARERGDLRWRICQEMRVRSSSSRIPDS